MTGCYSTSTSGRSAFGAQIQPAKETKMLKMRRIQTTELLGAALILMAVLAAAIYIRTTQVAPPSAPVSNAAVQNNAAAKPVAPAVQLAAVSAPHSTYVSEQTLRAAISEAADHHWDAGAQLLLRILNKRYEHRCCGLPR